jgi:hypothetical protein
MLPWISQPLSKTEAASSVVVAEFHNYGEKVVGSLVPLLGCVFMTIAIQFKCRGRHLQACFPRIRVLRVEDALRGGLAAYYPVNVVFPILLDPKFNDELTMPYTKPEDWSELRDLVYGRISTAPLDPLSHTNP